MSSGRTHDRITLWALPLVVLAAFRVTLSGWLTVVVCLGFLLGGWMLGPDLDIHSVQYKRWGWLRWIWLPYRGSIRHRSRWSHGPIIGTVVRVLYLSLWLGLGGLLIVELLNGSQRTALSWGDLIDGLGWALITYWPWWLALVVGLELGALSHYVADWLSSALKRKRSKSKKTAKPKAKPKAKLKAKPKAQTKRRSPSQGKRR
ncbi:metal-binding protein [Nodosilinea sp. E11]|uniref:metal-binding protein n=1 Tax=Nodosilinea sp. E11 TaxID=3037479 RepID=UPI002934B6ED|nr:metal-binding protein [Nodosilinea sp. E11]WOD39518.1 metal-binding protein [Nodosilinea sp. E11]